jgi:hypothetical protein
MSGDVEYLLLIILGNLIFDIVVGVLGFVMVNRLNGEG